MAYDQLKNKINSLEGRLVEIKRNFELSFQKRTEKSKQAKENEVLREKQKSKLTLKPEEKPEKDKLEKVAEHSVRRKPLQLKGDKADNMLQEYVTTFTCQSPKMGLLQCTS